MRGKEDHQRENSSERGGPERTPREKRVHRGQEDHQSEQEEILSEERRTIRERGEDHAGEEDH